MRRHGSGSGRYSGQYSPEQIATDTRNVENWLKDGRDVYVYYNNDIGGHAYYNALELAGRISGNQKEYGASAKRRTL